MSIINWLWDAQGGATLGVIWAIMGLGLYLTYRVLNFADMTVDGSLTLGGALSAVLVASGVPPMLAILIATVGGMTAGFVTGILHTKLKIPSLLAGILTQFGLYSINLRIMGKANFGLLNEVTLFTQVKGIGIPSKWVGLLVGVVFAAILVVLVYCFFGTEIGCALRATGNNPHMVEAMGANTKVYIVLGLVVGNGLVSMSGALLAQYQGYADINMGVGSMVIGLASIMIGEVLFSKRSYMHRLSGVVLGSVVYRIIIAFVLRISLMSNFVIKITADDMKLITAIIVVIALVLPDIKNAAVTKSSAKEGH